ncbi:MAG TPA: M48 family metalloprotease [Nodosilinea sp.]|nr:M48 family metalloprotease [Nodosilinea sp.]
MAQPIDPNSTPPSPERRAKPSVEAYYQQATAAFKAQNYARALVYFERLGQLPTHSPYYLKALMGQVRAHQRLGQPDQARAICQRLLARPAAQTWAHQVLSQLENAPASLPSSPATGADLSGFVPLEGSAPAAQTPPVPSPTESLSGTADGAAVKPVGHRSASEPAAPATDEGKPELPSLFHYQQLNQVPEAAPTQASPPPAPPPSESVVQPQPAGSRPAAGARSQPPASPLQRPLGLWVGQGLSAIAVLWATNWAFHFTLRTLDGLLRWIKWPVRLSLPGAYQSYTLIVVTGLIGLALASPWLLDFALALWHRQKPWSVRQLQATSPAALRLLRQTCRQQGWQLPELRLIADPAPLCFSYGWLPRNTRIVVSQGLIDQYADPELAAFFSYELARLANGSLPVLSAVGLPLLLLHTGYYRLAQFADRRSQPLLQISLGLVASGLYGIFWLLRQIVLWLSRLCCSRADRRAVALTQRPDQLMAVLTGLTGAIATTLRHQGRLHPLYTSLEVLMPVSSRQAISIGSLPASATGDTNPAATLIAVDGLNPYRQWLRVNASHLPLGERLLWFNQQALSQGQPVISLAPSPEPSALTPPRVSLPLLFLQKSPLVGLMTGGGIAMGLWFLGGVVNRLGWQRLSWLYQDPSILAGGLWLGLGLGLMLRVNTLFPDPGSTSTYSSSTDLVNTVAGLVQSPPPVPVQGKPVKLRGKLRGLGGVGNWGCQDLYLEDPSGLVKLTNPVPLGALQGAAQSQHHPLRWIGRQVTVTGWGRYGGGMLWIDIQQVQLDSQHQFRAYGPIWATLTSLALSLLGIFTIFTGG